MRRLQELRHPQVNHDRLNLINPSEGTILSDADYRLAVQHRLGCMQMQEPSTCRLCGGVLDVQANHALCCAKGEATKGHYAVVNNLVEDIRTADRSTATEVRGLAPSMPSARPADVLTHAAVPGCCAALDVVVASQDACGTGTDCTQTAYKRKCMHYKDALPDLTAVGIAFPPMACSTEGRPHPVTTRILACAAEQAARHHEGATAHNVQRRWKRVIATTLARRTARMIQACLPAPSGQTMFLMTGRR